MPAGRPTKYKKEFADILEKELANGYSFEACCGILGITKDTGYAWVKKYPEFSDAKKRGTLEGQKYWEDVGRRGLFTGEGEKFNSTVWVFTMKNRFGWRDKVETKNETKVEVDGSINHILTQILDEHENQD